MHMITAFNGQFTLEYHQDLNGHRHWFITENGVVIASEYFGDNVRKVWNNIRSKATKT